MNRIHLSQIVILGNRQRQEFSPEALQELKNSIEDQQLLHPPVLRMFEGQWTLVAGERRLRAITEIFELGGQFKHNGEVFVDGFLPFTDLGELSPLEAEEAELDENLKRRDLTWQEHAQAVSRLHALRSSQKEIGNLQLVDTGFGESVIKRVPGPHTIADTAEELTGRRDGSYQDSIRKEILVARHLDNPLISKAKSADEAIKILKKQEEVQKNQALSARIGASFTADAHTALHVNCLEWMGKPENQNQFDVILTDPPYGMNADSFGDSGGKLSGIEHHYDDSVEAWRLLMGGDHGMDVPGWCELSFKVTKPQAHAYVFCDIDRFHELKSMMEHFGWYVFRTPLIVHKLNSGRVPLPDQGPRRQWEMILYAIKGKMPVTHIYPDVIAVSGDENVGHGAQKPVALFQNLLARSVRPGFKILDSFCGSGPIFPAAHSYKCTAIGLELSAESYGMTLTRLQQLKQGDEITEGL